MKRAVTPAAAAYHLLAGVLALCVASGASLLADGVAAKRILWVAGLVAVGIVSGLYRASRCQRDARRHVERRAR